MSRYDTGGIKLSLFYLFEDMYKFVKMTAY